MIDETRVRLMNEAAMAEKHDKRRIYTAVNFFGSDFVVMQAIKTFIGVTIAYCIFVALLVMKNGEEISTQFTLAKIFDIVKGAAILYIIVLIAAEIITIFLYMSIYWRSKDKMTEYRNTIKKIDKNYRKADAAREDADGADTKPTRIKIS